MFLVPISVMVNKFSSWQAWWFKPVILGTWEVGIWGSWFQGRLGKKKKKKKKIY
jgi:hypothetical protein